MTTAPDHHEPLDAEERDLAARLGRIGSLDGPSPALDAKILAAAHAAAATRAPNRRHGLAWLGVPPALVTGMGVAAAAVLALGLVWQLRPQYSGIAAQGEAGESEEVILIAAPPASSARAPVANPVAPAKPSRSDDAAAARNAEPAAAAAMPPPSRDSASTGTTAPAVPDDGPAAAKAVAAAEENREADSVARDAAAESGFVAEPPATAPPAIQHRNHATYTTAARATAERREPAAEERSAAKRATDERALAERSAANMAAAASPPPAPAPAAAAADAERQALDRVEVTGSRIKQTQDVDWSQVPVSDDAHLAASEWLERIRARRDDDDTDNARASLRLFQREHPRIRLPDDLRALLADAKQ